MSDRKKLQQEMNRINELYHEYDLKLQKNGASMEERQKLRDMMNSKKNQLKLELGDDVTKLGMDKGITVKGANPALKKGGKMALKKLAGIIPLVGVGGAIMDSPAASASELIQDPEVQRAALSELAGPVGDIVDIGASAAEFGLDKYLDEQDYNKMHMGEVYGRRNYQKSQAAKDAADARGEPDPSMRKPIGSDRFEELSGENLGEFVGKKMDKEPHRHFNSLEEVQEFEENRKKERLSKLKNLTSRK